MQPSASTYKWEPLNGWLNFAKSHGVTNILYTFGVIAPWISSNPTLNTCRYGPGTCAPPTDLNSDGTGTDQAFKTFVTALANQGLGRINFYQLWDTPQDPTHWTGTAAQILRLSQDAYTIIKSIDPTATVLGPPVGAYHVPISNTCYIGTQEVKWFYSLSNTTGPATKYVDVPSFNTYFTSTAEDIVAQIQCLKTKLQPYGFGTAPLWATEGSWGKSSDLSNLTSQAAFLARSYLVQMSNGVVRFYWYSWNDPNWGTLWDYFTGNHPAGIAYAQVYKWVVGATLSQPCAGNSGVWKCVFTRANGYQAQAVWTTSGTTQTYTAPSQYINYLTLTGAKTAVPGTGQVTIGPSPILLQNQ